MAKLIKIETTWNYYSADLTDEQAALYNEDQDKFWDEFWDWDVEFEFIRDKEGGTDYQIED